MTASPTSQQASAEVRAEMARQRMGRSQLANRIGVSPAEAGKLVNGRKEWPLGAFLAAAEALGREPVEFFRAGRPA